MKKKIGTTIVLSERDAKDLMIVIQSLWTECDYQLDELVIGQDNAEIKLWKKDQLRCKRLFDVVGEQAYPQIKEGG